MRILFTRFPNTPVLPPPVTCITTNMKKQQQKDVVVIMGATGTGKSKLSVDLSTKFSGEVVNSDKIQLYGGLDITTNKIPFTERCGIHHHLLGDLDPADGELTPGGYRDRLGEVVSDVTARGKVPVVAGGSNSLIHAAFVGRYDPRRSPFYGAVVDEGLRYRCCFVWVDVEAAVLAEYLDRRVDEMIGEGMVEELRRYYANGEAKEGRNLGLGKAIGIPEFREYFEGEGRGSVRSYEAAVAAIKENTRRLAVEQVRKIERLKARPGWGVKRLDATAVVEAKLAGEGKEVVAAAWERFVLRPSVSTVGQFLEEAHYVIEQARRPQLANHGQLSRRSTTAITANTMLASPFLPCKLGVC